MPSNKPSFQIVVTQEQYDTIRKIANEEQRSISSLGKVMVSEFLSKREKESNNMKIADIIEELAKYSIEIKDDGKKIYSADGNIIEYHYYARYKDMKIVFSVYNDFRVSHVKFSKENLNNLISLIELKEKGYKNNEIYSNLFPEKISLEEILELNAGILDYLSLSEKFYLLENK